MISEKITRIDNEFTNIAKAIREKLGISNTYKISEMSDAIREISSEIGDYNTILDTNKIPTTRENISNDDNILKNSITTIPMFDTSNWKTCHSLFINWGGLTSIPLLDTSKVTSMVNMFANCTSLTSIPLLNTSNVTSMGYMFQNCTSLTSIPLLDTSKVTGMGYMFQNCTSLKAIPSLDTSNVTSMARIFYNCTSLETIPLLDTSKVTNNNSFLYSCTNLTNIYGFKDLGKAYTIKTTNYSSYIVSLAYSNGLTHDSLMNVINNLYDLNLTYNVENGGTLYRQQLKLGATNLAKLTEEEISIATNKGWNVVA